MELIGQVTAVAGVLTLLLAILWWLRRRGFVQVGAMRLPRGRRMERLERLALSPQHTLHLVRVADRALLIGAHAGGCTLLESMPLAAIAGPNAPEAR